MITSPVFAGKRYAVLGLARSGLATVRALVESGAAVTAWDESAEARAILTPGATLGDPMAIDLTGYDGIVVSPGVPLNTHPIAARANAAGVPVIGDIELFALARASLPPHKVVGITGTNGKSTTTALIHHILVTAGVPTMMGGNIGLPIMGQEPLPEGGVYVLELSSFQIDLTHSLDCDIAVLTNITPDHLDRYDGFEAYAASKARLFAMQSAEHVSIILTDDEPSRKILAGITTALWPATGSDWAAKGVSFGEGRANLGQSKPYLFLDGDSVIPQGEWPSLQGPHNARNAVAAAAVVEALSISRPDPTVLRDALRTYPGLPHRMERVGEIDGVLYVNDSKATNATSAAPALAAYPKVHWILGGRRKTDDLDACASHFGHVVAAYTIGESAELYKELLLRSGIYTIDTYTLEAAVRQASAVARPGETVLLSPACASYDQFRDYEARGDAFKAAVGMVRSRG